MTLEEHKVAILAVLEAAKADGCVLDIEVGGCCGEVERISLDQYADGEFAGTVDLNFYHH